tara:strand:- start:416 stop:1027 length:612 start_codon:yes stop_codon:yes gene_type:complete
MINIIPLFPKTVLTDRVNLPVNKVNELQTYSDSFDYVHCNNDPRACLQSKELHVLNKKLNLKKIFIQKIETMLAATTEQKTPMQITTSWFIKARTNEESNYHTHANSMLSAVYYWNNENNNKIYFENHNKSAWLVEHNKPNIYNTSGWWLEAENDLLVVFPSELSHKVGINQGTQIRNCLAINLIPVGKFGLNDSSLEIPKLK